MRSRVQGLIKSVNTSLIHIDDARLPKSLARDMYKAVAEVSVSAGEQLVWQDIYSCH